MANGAQVGKKVFAEEIKDGDRVRSVFLVKFKATPVKKNGEPYINLALVDRTGELEAKVWDNARELDKRFQKNDFIAVEGVANLYQGRLQLRLDDVKKVEESLVDISDFLPVTPYDIESMWAEACGLLRTIKNDDLKRLISSFIDDEQTARAFKRAPAAKEIHHSYVGGLLEHSLMMMRMADRICPLYPIADRDLVLAGCFLHDIGKTKELFYEKAFDYTDEGRLVGHIVFGVEIIDGMAAAVGGISEQLLMHLKHIILSHHGELEFGSPKRPKTVEALVVSQLDDLDARMNSWRLLFDKEPGEGWTVFQKIYDRYLYKGKPYRTPDASEVEGKGSGMSGQQPPPKVERQPLKAELAQVQEKTHKAAVRAPKPEAPVPQTAKVEPRDASLKFNPFAAQLPLITDKEKKS
jgi:3'-5' exoribonuclease